MTTEAANAGEPSKDFLGMSDEDFLKINSPGAAPVEAASVEVTPAAETQEEDTSGSNGSTVEDDQAKAAEAAEAKKTKENEDAAAAAETGGEAAADIDANADDTAVAAAADKKLKDEAAKADKARLKAEADKGKTPEQIAAETEAARVAAAKKPKTDAAEAAKPVDYEAFYKQILTPFKANGRTIELKTPEEAIRLMQMGAGYGRKIQDMQPHLKVLRMLEKNGLLDEGKISHLIDINQKNPDAIKKIIKDSGIDPLDLNIGDNVSYTPKNHSVSDEEMKFQEALGDIQSHPKGQETLQNINETWDPESKKALWNEPQILGIIQAQRDTGIYDQIVAEIDRQKLLGQIPNSTSFLAAYKIAGDHLTASNGFKIPTAQAQVRTQEVTPATVITTRAETPQAQVKNGDKAAAAAATKTNSQRKAATTVNPLAMADDDFLKQFNGRL